MMRVRVRGRVKVEIDCMINDSHMPMRFTTCNMNSNHVYSV